MASFPIKLGADIYFPTYDFHIFLLSPDNGRYMRSSA